MGGEGWKHVGGGAVGVVGAVGAVSAWVRGGRWGAGGGGGGGGGWRGWSCWGSNNKLFSSLLRVWKHVGAFGAVGVFGAV